MMDEQKYWRSIITNEIKAEHDRVRKYYSQRGANSGGITKEEQTRLNIFALCQSIASTYNPDIKPVNEAPEKPKKPRAPKVTEQQENKPQEPVKATEEPIQENVEKPVRKRAVKPSDKPQGKALQNEFGELL